MIIAGTGSPGLMKPEKELEETLEQRGITFHAVPSKEAMQLYNANADNMRVGACLFPLDLLVS